MKRENILFIIWLSFSFVFANHKLDLKSSQRKKGSESLQYEALVTLKLVQVYVADKRGRPVIDLEKSDFKLYDNGELKTITDFEKHVLYMPSTKSVSKQEKATALPAEKINRKFLLFFDFAFNIRNWHYEFQGSRFVFY